MTENNRQVSLRFLVHFSQGCIFHIFLVKTFVFGDFTEILRIFAKLKYKFQLIAKKEGQHKT